MDPIHTRSKTKDAKPAKRPRNKPKKLQNYVETVNLRKIDIKKYKRTAIAHTNNNLFKAVQVATNDDRTIPQLRAACAKAITSRTFSTLAKEYFTTKDEVAAHAEIIGNTGRGTEFDIYVLAHVTRWTLLVRDGRTMRLIESPLVTHRSGQNPAVLEVNMRFYDAMIKI